METARPATCPYCNGIFVDETPTDDHVFIKAMGGHVTIDAHRRCNSRIGHDIEGVLQRSNTLLNLQQQVTGEGKPLRATLETSGDRVEVDLVGRDLRFHKPIMDTEQDGVLTRMARGTTQQVDKVLKDHGFSPEQRDAMLAGAERMHLVDVPLRIEIRHDLALADRLTAKTALGAGALVDVAFGDSVLAARLRGVLWGNDTFDGRYADDPLEGFDKGMAATFSAVGLPRPPR